jgi:hypothetical protein
MPGTLTSCGNASTDGWASNRSAVPVRTFCAYPAWAIRGSP